jgi:hypothetical protein
MSSILNLKKVAILAVVAPALSFAQSEVSQSPNQVLCVVQGSEFVVAAPASECISGQKAAGPQDSAIVSRVKPNRIKKFLDNNDLKANVKLLDLDLVEGLSFGAKYKYQVEQSRLRPEYFTRVDRYVLGANINPGVLIDGLTPINFGFGQESEIIFAQQFDSGSEARKPGNGYWPKHLPVNSQKALSLKAGDYVRFNARMNAMLGVGQGLTNVPGLEAKVGLNYVVSGEFQVHFFRLDESRVRLKLVALRGNEKSASVEVGVKGLEIFGPSSIDKQFVKITNLDEWLRVKLSASNSDLFMVDYVINLSDERATQVYDGLFSSIKNVRTYKIANPLTKSEELANRLTSNIVGLEELALDSQELNKANPMDRVVNRIFKGTNSAYTKASAFRLGVLAVKLKRDERYRRNFLTRVQIDQNGREIPEHFVVPTWSLQTEKDGLLRKKFWGEEETFRSANALFTADSNGTPRDFQNISFVRMASDTNLSSAEYREVRAHVLRLLSDSGRKKLEEKIAGTAWESPEAIEAARLDLEYFFHAQALEELVKAGWANASRMTDELFKFIISQNVDWTEEYNRILELAKKDIHLANEEKNNLQESISQLHGEEIRSMAEKMVTMLSPNRLFRNGSVRRVEALTELRDSSFFKKAGPGFIVHLLKKSRVDIDKVMYVDLKIGGPGLPSVEVVAGEKSNRDLYDVVEFLEALLNGNEMDMRIAGPRNSSTTKVDVEAILERTHIAIN